MWSEERKDLHDAIVGDLYQGAADVPNEYRAIVAGGLTGAGKTTVLEKYAASERYFTIDPDSIKAELARRDMVPKVEGLAPMEISDLIHEETSYVAKMLGYRAQADGKNLIWDITMSKRSTTELKIDDLRAAGYTPR